MSQVSWGQCRDALALVLAGFSCGLAKLLRTSLIVSYAAIAFAINAQPGAAPPLAEDAQLEEFAIRVGELVRQAAAAGRPDAEPMPIPTVPGPDSLLFVYYEFWAGYYNLGRREAAQGDDQSGVILAPNVKLARPAVTGDGRIALLVSSDFDLCAVNTANFNSRQCLGFPGLVHSVAISPDAKLAAFVLRDEQTGQPEGKITLIDLAVNQYSVYNLVAPVADGVAVDTVLFADSMTFATDSTTLVYDALSELKSGNGLTVHRWSIYTLHLDSGQTSILVPPKDGVDFGNPALGRAGNRYITYDALEAATGVSSIMVTDLFTGQAAGVATSPTGYASPAFFGDESAVMYAAADPSAVVTGISLFKQDLTPDRLHTQGDPVLWYRDANLGVIYRRGAFESSNQPPTITLRLSSDRITLPESVTLTATAADPDGTVAHVVFYDGATRLGQADTEPFSFEWSTALPGNHLISARAVDNLGAETASSPRFLTVWPSPLPNESTPKLRVSATAADTVRLTVSGPPGYYIISMSEDMRAWADIYPVTIEAGGIATVDDSGGPLHYSHLFYRVRLEP